MNSEDTQFEYENSREELLQSIVHLMKEEHDLELDPQEDADMFEEPRSVTVTELTSSSLPVRDKTKDLFELAEILRKLIDEYIEEETAILIDRDAFVRNIRYEDKAVLNNRLSDKYSRYGLNDVDAEIVLKRVIQEKDQELRLPDLKKSILKLKDLHKTVIAVAYDLRNFEQRKR